MKKIYNYILLSALTFIAVGCINEGLEPDMPVTGSGNDVKFGLSFDESKTRTIYGAETNGAYPIFWSSGDDVLVASPQCASGRNSAVYEVTPKEGQSFAEALTAKGAYGVQWGSSTTADFYSVYPSDGTSWTSLTNSNVTAKLNIASEQSANIVLNGTTYSAADMNNVIMYAQTNGVKNGETVNLKYKPYSTILEFELNIAENIDEEGNPKGFGSVKVFSLTLTAPKEIALTGDFSLKFNGTNSPTITAAGNNGNSIKMEFATQPVLDSQNQTLKAKLAMIPLSGVEELQGWTVAVEVLEGTAGATKVYKKTLNIDAALEPGKIHEIKLQKFYSETAWEPDLDKWITTLYDYKNIYLTELSLPGAWYSLGKDDDGYQATGSTATKLWNAGVRAFAVECRALSPYKPLNGDTDPNRVVVSGQGSKHTLGGAYIQRSGTPPYISTIIQNIAGAINSNEFGVLVLSYADGGSGGHREKDYKYFIQGIQNEITQSGASNIYSDEITPKTTVSDVLGQLIIKINVDDRIPNGSYDGKMNALLSYNPFIQNINPLFSKMYWMGWDDGNKNYYTSFNEDDFWWCFSSANRTHTDGEGTYDIPTYEQRKTALRGMIQHSKEITSKAGTNVWFYFNAGGTEAESSGADTKAVHAQNFAKTINPWLLDVIKLKANGGTDTNGVLGTKGAYIESDPSPLGIVMFNQCTGNNATYHGADIIDEIVKMNNKADLLRATTTIDPDKPKEPVPDEGDEV